MTIINKNSIITIAIASFLLFSFKWIISFYFFKDNLSAKIIFDTPSDGYFYYVYLEILSSLNFNNSFDLEIDGLKTLPIPFYAILIPSLMKFIFGNYSFLLLEFINIFLFIIIFFLIFRKLEFSNNSSIILSLLLFNIPTILQLLGLNLLPYISNLNEIYNLRFPRPLIVNIFNYIFLLYLIFLKKENFFNYKNFIILGILLSLSFSSFYYFFLIQLITFFLFCIYTFRFKVYLDIKNYKYYFTSLFIFLILSLPFVFFLIFSEPDYQERLYIINLDFEKKLKLLHYLFLKLFSIKSLLFIFFICILNFFIFKKNFKNFEKINIFFILFLSSILAPFIFIIFSSKTGLVYHFTNLIIINGFIYIFVTCFLILNKKKIIDLILRNFIYYCSVIFFLFLYNLNVYLETYKKSIDEDYMFYRQGIFEAQKIIDQLKIEDTKLLTFNSELMVWAILNDIKHIKPISGQLVPKKHYMIEEDLIETFKFLNLSSDDFINFFENKSTSWRLFNKNTQLFFWGRYSASTLKTFKDSKNFTPSEMMLINTTSPLNVQSIAIPKDELIRLKRKFNEYNDKIKIKPNIIVLNSNDEILKRSFIENYCIYFLNNKISILIENQHKNLCQKKY